MSFLEKMIHKQAHLQAAKLGDLVATASATVKDIASEVQRKQPGVPIERTGATIGGYLDTAASYLRDTEGPQLVADLETFASARPAVAIAGAAALAFVAARVAKLSADAS